VEIPDVIHQLLQTGCDGKAAAVGHPAEKDVEIGDALLHPLSEITVGHGHLIKVKQHGEIERLVAFHSVRSSISVQNGRAVLGPSPI
jgi:hypothetical protein